MKIIQKLSDMIEEELEDAEKYIRCAINYKEERPALANVFASLSDSEMDHMASLHTQVATIIQDYRKEHGDPPEKMQALYDYLHDKHKEKATAIRVMQGLFRSKS